jgi:hypothetical protein
VPQVRDMYINRPCLAGEVVTPHHFQQAFAAEHASGIACQNQQQIEFLHP